MSKPEYFSKKKFDDIAKMDAGVLTDDYVHNSNETWKFKATSK